MISPKEILSVDTQAVLLYFVKDFAVPNTIGKAYKTEQDHNPSTKLSQLCYHSTQTKLLDTNRNSSLNGTYVRLNLATRAHQLYHVRNKLLEVPLHTSRVIQTNSFDPVMDFPPFSAPSRTSDFIFLILRYQGSFQVCPCAVFNDSLYTRNVVDA
jgi:hypothetical protein